MFYNAKQVTECYKVTLDYLSVNRGDYSGSIDNLYSHCEKHYGNVPTQRVIKNTLYMVKQSSKQK